MITKDSPIRFYDDMEDNINDVLKHNKTDTYSFLIPVPINACLVPESEEYQGQNYVDYVVDGYGDQARTDEFQHMLNSEVFQENIDSLQSSPSLTSKMLKDIRTWCDKLRGKRLHGNLNGRLFLDFDFVINKLNGVSWPKTRKEFKRQGGGLCHLQFAIGTKKRFDDIIYTIDYLESNDIEVYILTNNTSCENKLHKSFFVEMISFLHDNICESRLLCGVDDEYNKLRRLYRLYYDELLMATKAVHDSNLQETRVIMGNHKIVKKDNEDDMWTIDDEIEEGYETLHEAVIGLLQTKTNWFDIQKQTEETFQFGTMPKKMESLTITVNGKPRHTIFTCNKNKSLKKTKQTRKSSKKSKMKRVVEKKKQKNENE